MVSKKSSLKKNNRPRYYTKEGKPIQDIDKWLEYIEQEKDDPEFRKVANTWLPDGRWISTVWLGIDHRFDLVGKPLIFETMMFPNNKRNFTELDMDRYSTWEEAIEGHMRMVKKWLEKAIEKNTK